MIGIVVLFVSLLAMLFIVPGVQSLRRSLARRRRNNRRGG